MSESGIRYGTILADPPWKWTPWSAKGRGNRAAEHHYKTQEMTDLIQLPVNDFAASACALFLWVVDSHLDQGIEVMKKWGFVYKTIAFIWVKGAGLPLFPDDVRDHIGLGKWTRKSAEVCLLGTLGKPQRLNADVRQVILDKRREHSRKPDEIYSRIERLVAGPYLELFARQHHPGWDSWGDQTSKFDSQ